MAVPTSDQAGVNVCVCVCGNAWIDRRLQVFRTSCFYYRTCRGIYGAPQAGEHGGCTHNSSPTAANGSQQLPTAANRSLPTLAVSCSRTRDCEPVEVYWQQESHSQQEESKTISIHCSSVCENISLSETRVSITTMHLYPKRAPLQQGEGLASQIFKLVATGATPEQWAEWLRVPLEHAAARGNLGLVNVLLGAGANGGAGWRGCRGRTLLDAAAIGGNPEVVSAFIRAGAEPDVNVVSVSSRRSALYAATYCGHEAAARRLILAGADVNFQDPVDRRYVLSLAVQGGHTQIVNDLLICGADPSSSDEYGLAPVHIASVSGKEGILSALLLAKADKDARDVCGESALLLAVDRGRLAIVETLLAAGADCNIRRLDTYSALDLSAAKGHIPILSVILRYRADPNARDPVGCTPLHTATLADQGDSVHVLIKAGADTNLKADGGWAALHAAARHHRCKAMLALLQNKAAVNTRIDSSGDTPLHRACCKQRRGLETAVDLLLRWGADETALNNRGRTPEQVLGSTRVRNRHCSSDEVERARLLLVRAPADRSWRRRGWLVIFRSHAKKIVAAWDTSCVTGGGTGNDFHHAAVDQEGKDRKISRNDAVGGVGHDRGDAGLSGVVALLVWLEPEAVFRSVIGFL